MTAHQKIAKHIKSLGEIKEIMSSMKVLSVLEIRKLSQLIVNQERIVLSCEQVAQDFINFYPILSNTKTTEKCCLLVIGSERGFCGDFNDQLVAMINEKQQRATPQYGAIIAVGQKLCMLLDDHSILIKKLDGVLVTEETNNVIQAILKLFADLQANEAFNCLQVMYYQHSNNSIRLLPLTPPFADLQAAASHESFPPVINLSPDQFYSELVEQYLFYRLYDVFYSSLQTENQKRIKHLESAIDRLEEKIEHLTRKRQIFRQEEITEEIEIILLNADSKQTKF